MLKVLDDALFEAMEWYSYGIFVQETVTVYARRTRRKFEWKIDSHQESVTLGRHLELLTTIDGQRTGISYYLYSAVWQFSSVRQFALVKETPPKLSARAMLTKRPPFCRIQFSLGTRNSVRMQHFQSYYFIQDVSSMISITTKEKLMEAIRTIFVRTQNGRIYLMNAE